MKIRMGFVSNSSSSSFVIVRKDDMDDKKWEQFCSEIASTDIRGDYDIFSSIHVVQGFSNDYPVPPEVEYIANKHKLSLERFTRCLK